MTRVNAWRMFCCGPRGFCVCGGKVEGIAWLIHIEPEGGPVRRYWVAEECAANFAEALREEANP